MLAMTSLSAVKAIIKVIIVLVIHLIESKKLAMKFMKGELIMI